MRGLLRGFSLLGCFTLLALAAPAPVDAQAQQALVIQGGTLIDGNGGAPVANSFVVIQGSQITAVGPAGRVQVPAGAQAINASGKWVLPGLWDAQVNYSWFWGELFLHHGVTSLVDIGLGSELSIADRDSINKGLGRGPRQWIGVAHFGGFDEDEVTGYETPYDGQQMPKTLEDVQHRTRALLDAGADMIMFHDGRWDPAWVKSACDEAHRRGKPCFQRPSGPRMRPADAALAGVDVFHHSQGVGQAVMRDGTTTNNELERYGAMDEARARALVDLMVGEQVYLVPNIIHIAPGYPREWPRMQADYERLFSSPALLAYYDEAFLARLRFTRNGIDRGAVRERRLPGYHNFIRFHKMYLDAGGKVLVGGDTNGAKVPGSIVHEEMAIFQEGGFPRMAIIQAATKWPAEAMRVADRIGTIARGKLADIIIVNADPLQDIQNLRNIDTVIQNGKVQSRDFNPSYSTPFGGRFVEDRFTIGDMKWVRALKREHLAGGGGAQAPDPWASPQPAIEMISPTRITQGAPTTTLTLRGFNFVARTRVYYDGGSVPYRRVSQTELQVTLDSQLLNKPGRYPIVVKNPEPMEFPIWGTGTSNVANLIVQYR